MNSRRVVVLITGLAVAALGLVLAAMQWDRANQIAVVVACLAAVAALGVEVWAALPMSGQERGSRVRVTGTGKATAGPGGTAVSGVSVPAGSAPGQVEVIDSGDADASGGGEATSGVRWT